MKFQNHLIGITGTEQARKRYTARLIRQALELRHYNLRQPVLHAAAAAIGMEPERFDRLIAAHPIPALKCTAGELVQRINAALNTLNPDYLLADVQSRMAHSGATEALFNGNVISGITTENEADWLRKRGGILVHLRNTDAIRDPLRLVHVHNDDVLLTFRGDASDAALQGLIDTLRERCLAAA